MLWSAYTYLVINIYITKHSMIHLMYLHKLDCDLWCLYLLIIFTNIKSTLLFLLPAMYLSES